MTGTARRDVLIGGAATMFAAVLPTRASADVPAPTWEGMIPVPGGRVYVRVNGDLRGRRLPVILAHGGPGGTHAGLTPALALADERAVILYDQLDTGRSERTGNRANWTVARFTDELEAIRAHLKVPRWHMGGFSWGGTLALEYGARAPAALAGLVLGSPLIATRDWIADADAWRRELPADVQETLTACERPRPPAPAACSAAEAAFYARHLIRTRANTAVAAYAERTGVRGNDEMYRAMWGPSEFTSTGSLRDYDGTALLAKLPGARTLFVTGQYDEARPATVMRFAARVPDAEIAVVPGSGHALFIDRSAETLAILRAFLARHDPA